MPITDLLYKNTVLILFVTWIVYAFKILLCQNMIFVLSVLNKLLSKIIENIKYLIGILIILWYIISWMGHVLFTTNFIKICLVLQISNYLFIYIHIYINGSIKLKSFDFAHNTSFWLSAINLLR